MRHPTQDRMVAQFKTAYRGSVSSLVFARWCFDLAAAKAWARENGFRDDIPATTPAYYLLGQSVYLPRESVRVALTEDATIFAVVSVVPGGALHRRWGHVEQADLESVWAAGFPSGEPLEDDENDEAEERNEA